VVDGEAIAVDDNGLSVFDLIRYRRQDHAVTICAFDLLELDGVDLRREPIEVRKRTLQGLLRRAHPGIAFNRHFDVEGACLQAGLRARNARALCRSALVRSIAPAAPIVG
jgi:ATP-dependent DNA ligase